MIEPRPEIAALPRVIHGAVKDSELTLLAGAGIDPARVIDFSVNSNPLGPSPRVAAALREVDVSRYPDDEATELRDALAARFGVTKDQVLVANGSAEAIWLICLAFLSPGDTVAIREPAFGEYQRAARLAGAHVTQFQTAAWQGDKPRIMFLCNPNNPTGDYLDRSEVERILEETPEALLVIDEAYAGFLTPESGLHTLISLLETGRVLLLRSMTKDYAIAGLRLGYVLGPGPLIDALARAKPPWSVNRAALAAGLVALQDVAHMARSRTVAADAVTYLQKEITSLGFAVKPSRANFFLMELGDGARVRAALLSEGLVVRDCASFGLPSMIRIAARPLEDCQRLVRALSRVRVPA